MSRHEGVSCDNCLTSNFQEKRFKCLICYDYDLCEVCYENKVSTSRHSPSHPMQCILTKHDFDLFYGGEGITMDNPPSLTCPLCGKRGLTEVNLQEHVNTQHIEASGEVVCPICAAIPTGDPNHVTDDFAAHLAIEHYNSQRANAEDPIASRQSMRRMFYPGRNVAVRGARAQRSANMHFSGGPSAVPGFGSVANAAGNPLPHMRDPYTDPIAELLSQLSGVRRNAQQLQQTVSTASQLQELQAQLQLERQRASIIRQQLERIPGKIQSAHTGKQTSNQAANSQSKSYATAVKTADKESSVTITEDEDPRLLLSQVYDKDTDSDSESQSTDIFEQSLFVRELILSLPVDNDSTALTDSSATGAQTAPITARAIPVDCGVLTTTEKNSSGEKSTDAKEEKGAKAKSTDTPVAARNVERAELSIDDDITEAVVENNVFLSKESVSYHGEAAGLDVTLHGARKSNSEEKPNLHQKKESANLRPPQYSSGASNVPGLVRPQSSFPLLVSGATEQ